jgi:glycosyltransferase involved in cell wall biosynthesis
MRILHVVSSLNVGGAERFVIDLATEQKNNSNFEVSILSMGQPGEPLEEEVNKGNIKLLHDSSIYKIHEQLEGFDLVHIHSSHCLLRILLATFFISIKVVYTRHNERVHKSLKWRVVYLIAKMRLHKIIFVSEKAKFNYLNQYKSLESKSDTILNGVLPMTTKKKNSNYLRFSHVGRFVPLKAQHILIEAAAKLPNEIQQNISLTFFGTGALLEKNRALAEKLIPNIKISFRGFVTNRDDIYQNTDILVVTSETEGLSLAILEALASGTPTIASKVGGNPELVRHEENGLLYQYADSQTLAENMVRLYREKSLYKDFSIKSIAIYQQGFSMSLCARNYSIAYQ